MKFEIKLKNSLLECHDLFFSEFKDLDLLAFWNFIQFHSTDCFLNSDYGDKPTTLPIVTMWFCYIFLNHNVVSDGKQFLYVCLVNAHLSMKGMYDGFIF